jgi:hypothetical protein
MTSVYPQTSAPREPPFTRKPLPHTGSPAAAGLRFLDVIFFAEAFDTARSIDKFLLARKERVASGTYFHFYILGCRAGFDNITAYAGNRCRFVIRVNSIFHKVSSFSNAGGIQNQRLKLKDKDK